MLKNSRAPAAILFSVLVGGCAVSQPLPKAALDHPANPNAAEGPMQPASQTLVAVSSVEPSPTSDESMPGMQHGGMKGMDHDMPGMKHNAPSSQAATTQAVALYTCTMHPEVISDKPGKCPKCGMKLVAKKDAKTSGHGRHE